MRRAPLSLTCTIFSLLAVGAASLLQAADPSPVAAERPNVLWITSEDNGPQLGCYGDSYANTPHLDALAKKGTIYLHCWSNAPVCAPARTCLITGMYPPSMGGQHMRSMVRLPEGFRMYPQYLRDAGYYCTNNSKEDYNVVKPGKVWDDSSRTAHWKNRRKGQPFFAIFNHTISHESQIRNAISDADRLHDPAQVRVPAYHPDTPEVRKDWAQYYDRLTMMDARAGKNLAELEEAGLADDTIVFYYGDHGSGMPRSKRWPFNSGLHVPLIVYIPPKWQHLATEDYAAGGRSDRLVSFVDLPPTLLNLCGVKIPEHFQGHAFLGKGAAEKQPYIYGFRGRMDERFDMVRSLTDGRYVYIRNFMPHRIYGQYIQYMFQTPTTARWRELFDAGKLNAAQSHFWQPKPAEELYDLQNDPDEVHNLASDPAHTARLTKMRTALREHMLQVRDLGLLPEGEMHARSEGSSPYEYGHGNAYDLPELLTMAEQATDTSTGAIRQLADGLSSPKSEIRYWAAIGCVIRGEAAVNRTRSELRGILRDDDSAAVRIIAAEALGRYGNQEDVKLALPVLIEHANVETHGVYEAMLALNALDHLDERASTVKTRIAELPRRAPSVNRRMGAYVGNLIDKTLADLQQN